MMEIKIELRVDYSDKQKDEIMVTAAKMAARHLLAQAALIAEKRKPQIVVMCGDMFTAPEEIEILDDVLSELNDT
jgi:hypothetical protein